MEKPTFSQRMKSLGLFLWNGETKEFLGRGGRSWAEIGLFYLVFYACLSGFFIATIAVFYETIDADNPRLQGESSLLKGNPGMGYQPMPDIDTTLIYARTSEEDTKAYVKSINKVLDAYKNESLNRVNCSDLTQPRTDSDKACNFDFANLTQECNEENGYGFKHGQPCILLKLNKIFGWIPSIWDEKDVSDVPKVIKDVYLSDRIWVQCHGENPADEDNLGDKDQIKYFPQQGFPLGYYPFKKQLDYLPPLIFVKFSNVTHYTGIMVECQAFGKNIALDRSERQGSVHFELLVEPSNK
ncbi:unnamed protein product [Lymnaea stagnalis]|uniref:Sodium/potassium-transporting ATPase subunit beta n=1 Tax=Lymnaea stagnalis TaxID=6523 RepID=A0AAV2I402_LYMST